MGLQQQQKIDIFSLCSFSKILKQVEYESARRKRHINEKTRKRDEAGSTFLLCTFMEGTQGNSRELKGTQGNSRELKGTQGNSKFFKGSARRSNRRKKLRKRGEEGKFRKSEKKKKKKKRENIE